MAFTSRRGRPPAVRADTTDYGTPELRAKRMVGLTEEPLDACLTRQLISPSHHRSGLHLRWLYTVRYGAPVLTSRYREIADSPAAPRENDEFWRTLREAEYHEAVAVLHRARLYEPIFCLCIYNDWPDFLKPATGIQTRDSQNDIHRLHTHREHVVEGLELLKTHWHF